MAWLPIAASILPSLFNGISGGIQNGAMQGINQQDEAFQLSMYAEQTRHSEQMQLQSNAFDELTDERSENMREVNALRDISLQQRKADNEITKKFIATITE